MFFHEWVSSRTGRRAAQIIMGIWRTEDAKRGMTTKGQLTNTKRPTAGTGKRTEWVPTGEVAYGFQSRERRKETESISAAIDGEQMLKKVSRTMASCSDAP